ncbi:carboxypeptidase C (cathepsin A) [Sphingobium sp. OAS761]|uniref:S10 family serine carboxypeptidase-like protein n=1 Tax=Sphingobium sp. OAS761 TaxID=2817901 RepID=UPI00209DB84C|nr:carboxypeptidase C (cathepsin A) [Sphingobium sp. OAS761]
MTSKRKRLIALIAAFCLLPDAVSAAGTGEIKAAPSASSWPALTFAAQAGPRRFSATRRGMFGGRQVAYVATLQEMLIKDSNGKPASSLFVYAFTAKAQDATSARPVIFVFNGGPGAASNTLMFGALGPHRLARFDMAAMADTSVPLVDNRDSVLDVADLVFIDAPETGFGRPLPGADAQTFRSNDGDSFAFAQVILRWLIDQGRMNAPVYIAGESYGSLRSVMLARDLAAATPHLSVAGLILISQAITYNGPPQASVRRLPDPLRAAMRLPDIVALSWYHGLIDNRARTLGQAIEAAQHFVQTDYAPALIAGNRLAPAERAKVAGGLARLTGISAERWIAGGLRIDNPRRQLLADKGKALGQFDGRETEPLDAAPQDADRDWEAMMRGLTRTSELYAAALGAKGVPAYRSTVPAPYDFEDTWGYIKPPAPLLDLVLQEQMRAQPGLRLMVTQGVFDTTSSMGATDYLFSQLDVPPDRISFARYGGGHMLYSDDAGRAAFAADIRAFVTGRPIASRGYPTVAPASAP